MIFEVDYSPLQVHTIHWSTFLSQCASVVSFSNHQLSTKQSSNIRTITLLKRTLENDFTTNTETTPHHFVTKNTETWPTSANISGLLNTRTLTTSFHGLSFHQAQPTIAQVKDAITALKRNFSQSADLICHHLTNVMNLYLLAARGTKRCYVTKHSIIWINRIIW